MADKKQRKGGLCLSRKVGERIFIEDVEIEVVRIERGKVKLRIVADPCVRIDRAEIHEKKLRSQANKEAELCGISS